MGTKSKCGEAVKAYLLEKKISELRLKGWKGVAREK